MTQLKGDMQLKKGKDRLIEPIFLLSVICGSVSAAFAFKVTGNADYAAECGFQSLQFDRYVMLPVLDPIGQLLEKNEVPDRFKFRLDEQPKPETAPTGPSPLEKVFLNVILHFFVEFFEKNKSWIKSKFGQHHKFWPPTWQFAKVVRDAASHDGAIKITDQAFVPVSWHNLTYGLDQNGRQIFGVDLSLADILILMIEMSETLDKAGCPVSS